MYDYSEPCFHCDASSDHFQDIVAESASVTGSESSHTNLLDGNTGVFYYGTPNPLIVAPKWCSLGLVMLPPFCCLERCCRLNAKDFSSLGNSPSATHLPLFLPPFGTWELSLLKKRIPPPQRRKEPKNDSKIHITSFAPKHIVGVWMELRS